MNVFGPALRRFSPPSAAKETDGETAAVKQLSFYSLFVLAIALIALVVGCSGETDSTSTTVTAPLTTAEASTTTTTRASTTTTAPPSTTTTNPTPTTAPTTVSVETPEGSVTLSARQLAGQRVIYSYAGLTPPKDLLSLIRRGEAAGVIFFADNISTRAQIKAVIATFEQANESAENPVRAPLLLMADQEGGGVRRLPGAPVLSQKGIGRSTDPAGEAAKAGAGAAENLSGVGMNVNLSPVLDVYRQPGGFEDKSGRSYSASPEVVANLGAAFIRSQQEGGVAATAKHFPGLGAATALQDTDARPVTLKVSTESLRSVDEFPYKAAIQAGVRLVMLSWAVYPGLDAKMPAGLSSTIIKEELRDRLGFQGVTVTDSLGAMALQAFGSPRHRALLAAQAGMDLLLCAAGQVAQGQQAFSGLYDRYLDGTLAREDFQAAAQRVIDLRFSLEAR